MGSTLGPREWMQFRQKVLRYGPRLRGAVKSNKPTVINLMLTQELGDPFRRDAFRQPRRLLPKYRKYSAREYR